MIDKIVCGVDIGSQQIKATLLRIRRSGQIDILGIEEAPMRGLKKNGFSDMTEFSQNIHMILSGLSRKTGFKMKDVQLGIGGPWVASRFSRAVIPLLDHASKVVTEADIKKINKQARMLGVKMEEEILHDFPQYYILDDGNKVLDPLGMYARKMAVGSLLIVMPVNLLMNIRKAVLQGGYEIAHVYFSPLASSYACLTDEMTRRGCLLIDMGAATTNILFFKEGFLRSLDIIPFGGDHLTQALSESLHLPFELAEDIKKSSAMVLKEDLKSAEEILVKKDDGYLHVKQDVVFETVESQVMKLEELIQEILQFSHVREKLSCGVVLCGGASLLTGLIERLEKDWKLPVSLGKLQSNVFKNACLYAGAVGLAISIQRKQYRGSPGVLKPKNFLGRVTNHVQVLYEEYF